MREASFKIIEHTADIGIRVKSSSLVSLFKCAALAITAISSQKQKIQYPKKYEIVIKQEAEGLEELFVNWLNELLSVSSAEALVFEDIRINQISEKFIHAVAIGIDIRNYKINTEIKAATYHQVKVKKIGRIWQAEVIFDV